LQDFFLLGGIGLATLGKQWKFSHGIMRCKGAEWRGLRIFAGGTDVDVCASKGVYARAGHSKALAAASSNSSGFTFFCCHQKKVTKKSHRQRIFF
jgi:hypothetical protein